MPDKLFVSLGTIVVVVAVVVLLAGASSHPTGPFAKQSDLLVPVQDLFREMGVID